MDQKDHIKQLLLSAQKKAAIQVQRVRAQSPLTKEFLQEALRQYILSKYLLDEEDCTGDGLDELTEISLAKSMAVSKELVKEFDQAKNCSGGTSAMTKKVLLLMAIQREFDVYLPTEGTGTIKTVADLSDLVWTAMGEAEYWVPVLQQE